MVPQWRLSQSRRCRLGTRKPKRLSSQRSLEGTVSLASTLLVDSTLSALVISGMPPPFVHGSRRGKRIPSSNNLHDLDLEIDRTLHRLRKIKNTDVGSSDSFNYISNSINNSFATNSEFPHCSNSSIFIKPEPTCGENKSEELEHMENQD
ncbi:hypothetical protein CR513_26069, partial [Mucuna pruriens]